jgi:hypothetical protein
MNRNSMRAFRGFFSPGLYFADAYGVRIYNFTSTPPEVEPFFQIWLLMPNGQRVLYVDPYEAGEIVSQWYHFDRIVGASTAWDWADAAELHIHMMASDKQTLELDVRLGSSWATRLLNAVIKTTPQALMRSRPMLAVSSLGFNLLLGLGGVSIAGKTGTGKAYVTEADRIAIFTAASANLNGRSLGQLSPPPEALFFDTTRIAARPILAFGTVNIEPPNP